MGKQVQEDLAGILLEGLDAQVFTTPWDHLKDMGTSNMEEGLSPKWQSKDQPEGEG